MKALLIPIADAEQLLDYLKTQPYGQVNRLINALANCQQVDITQKAPESSKKETGNDCKPGQDKL